MAKEFFIGKTNNTAKKPLKILVGNSSNIAKEVKSIFVGNSSNQAVKVFPSFPDIYQKCEYIYNTNLTEYINTGIYPNSNTRYEIRFKIVNIIYADVGYDGNSVFGTDVSNGFVYYYIKTGTTLSRTFYVRFDNTYVSEGLSHNSILDVECNLEYNKAGGLFYLNNTQVGSSTRTFSTMSLPIILFGYSSAGSTSPSKIGYYIYHFQAWQDNTLISDMYPCYEKADTLNVGMYDVIRGVFYGNSGTGIFYKGPDIN